MKQFDDNLIDTLITDPPVGIGFMGKKWDHHRGGREKWIDYMSVRFAEALRIIKPGGLAIVWALPRTAHWTACAIEDAGWFIDTKMYFLFGGGWPKSLDISKGIDKHFGCERKKIDNPLKDKQTAQRDNSTYKKPQLEFIRPEPVHEQAKKWNGYRTQLKPMCEGWIICRKPVDKNFVNNALTWKVGGYNIDKCRIEGETIPIIGHDKDGFFKDKNKGNGWRTGEINQQGRYPGNVVIDDEVAEDMDWKSGILTTGEMKPTKRANRESFSLGRQSEIAVGHNGSIGGASRYFMRCNHHEIDYYYGGKAASSEKNKGLENIDERLGNKGSPRRDGKRRGEFKTKNDHPTVKSIDLMRYLCRLSKPPDNGIVLDIFAGTFSTAIAAYLESRKFIMIEESQEYCEIGSARLKAVMEQKKFNF